MILETGSMVQPSFTNSGFDNWYLIVVSSVT